MSNFRQLQNAASSPPAAHVTAWLVPMTRHAQAFKNTGSVYVARVVGFFDASLGADRGSSGAGA